MKRDIAVIYIVVLLSTIAIISTYQISRANNESFRLDIIYNWHRRTYSSTQLFDIYDSYAIQRSVSIQSYRTTVDHLEVYGYPLWLDVSDWSQGQSVIIGGVSYETTREFQNWKAHRGYADYSADLYYDGEFGFLVRISINTMIMANNRDTEYSSIDVDLGMNNLGELAYYASGRYLVYDNLLIIGIFAELAIIDWLVMKRKNSKKPGTESSDLNPTTNSLSVLK